MRRRFRLSRRSAETFCADIGAVDPLAVLRSGLVGIATYLASRGIVSVDDQGGIRRFVGEVLDATAASSCGYWVAVVSTTEAYEARQHEEVGGQRLGRQDLDAVEEEQQRRLDAYAKRVTPSAPVFSFALAADTTVTPGQSVFAVDATTVSPQQGLGTIPLGHVVAVQPNGDVQVSVAEQGVVVTMPTRQDGGIAATAEQVQRTINTQPRTFVSIGFSTTAASASTTRPTPPIRYPPHRRSRHRPDDGTASSSHQRGRRGRGAAAAQHADTDRPRRHHHRATGAGDRGRGELGDPATLRRRPRRDDVAG